jgi:hypothetical protein
MALYRHVTSKHVTNKHVTNKEDLVDGAAGLVFIVLRAGRSKCAPPWHRALCAA